MEYLWCVSESCIVRMATKELAASSPAPTPVQQGLREVLLGDLPTTDLPRKDVEGVRGLEGQFLVIGVTVEFKRAGEGNLGVEEWRRYQKLFEASPHRIKSGDVLTVTRNTERKMWEVSCSSLRKSGVKLGWSIRDGELREVEVGRGGLVKKDKLSKVEVRGDGEIGLLLLCSTFESERLPEGQEVYTTRRI